MGDFDDVLPTPLDLGAPQALLRLSIRKGMRRRSRMRTAAASVGAFLIGSSCCASPECRGVSSSTWLILGTRTNVPTTLAMWPIWTAACDDRPCEPPRRAELPALPSRWGPAVDDQFSEKNRRLRGQLERPHASSG